MNGNQQINGDEQNQRPTNELARPVHWTLLSGLVASALLMIVGLFLTMVKNEPRMDLPPHQLSELLRLAVGGDGVACLELGILLLLLTPILRVIVLAVGWAARREGRIALVALTVLVLLVISLVLGTG